MENLDCTALIFFQQVFLAGVQMLVLVEWVLDLEAQEEEVGILLYSLLLISNNGKQKSLYNRK